MGITHSLMPRLDPLLRPERLIPAAEIVADLKLIPDEGGIYGWWFDAELPGIDSGQTLRLGNHRLLYIGIAPRAPAHGRASKSTLRKRIRHHHLGRKIGSSTLRRTLAWLLRSQLGLEISRRHVGARCRDVMSTDQEYILTTWLQCHAALSVLTVGEAWRLERALIRSDDLKLPLNIVGCDPGARRHLIDLRRSSLPRAAIGLESTANVPDLTLLHVS